MEIDNGYWKLLAEEETQEIMKFFTPDRNWQWKVMPMGYLNAAPTFVAIMMNLQMEWDTLSKDHRLENVASETIVDNVLLYGHTTCQLLVSILPRFRN